MEGEVVGGLRNLQKNNSCSLVFTRVHNLDASNRPDVIGAMRTELVITCVTSCASFVWIVFLVKKRLDRFKRLDRLNDRSFGSF